MNQAAQSFIVRTAQPDDVAGVVRLLVELGYAGNGVDDVRQRLAVWAREPAGVTLVADQNDRVV